MLHRRILSPNIEHLTPKSNTYSFQSNYLGTSNIGGLLLSGILYPNIERRTSPSRILTPNIEHRTPKLDRYLSDLIHEQTTYIFVQKRTTMYKRYLPCSCMGFCASADRGCAGTQNKKGERFPSHLSIRDKNVSCYFCGSASYFTLLIYKFQKLNFSVTSREWLSLECQNSGSRYSTGSPEYRFSIS